MQCVGFPPILPDKPKVMILGTMPSQQSLLQAFYYAHPRNAFWPIMADLFHSPIETNDQKVQLCVDNGLLVWDVLQTCVRQGSLDSAISEPVANDFASLLHTYPTCRWVLFNGNTAAALFAKWVVKQQNLPKDLVFATLPSTSPANARLSFENKRDCWQASLQQIL